MASDRTVIPWDWFGHHLRSEILPRWLESAVTPSGFYCPKLDRQWRQQPGAFATLVSQSRLLYVFSVGHDLCTGELPYREAVEGGSRFLLEHFGDGVHGGWFWSCSRDGAVLDPQKDAYGHAFSIFGLAHAARCTEDTDLLHAAAATWEIVADRFLDRHGGLIGRFERDWSPCAGGGTAAERKSQNPVMHLFEALVVLGALPTMDHIRDAALEIAAFVLERLQRKDGAVPELFSADWDELSAEDGGWINIGHQFEWAYLLSAAVEQGYPRAWLEPAERMLDWGIRVGLDENDGGAHTYATPEATVRAAPEGGKGWWEQCEATRAMVHWATVRGRSDLWPSLLRNLQFIWSRLLDHQFGGWYMSSVPRRRDKGSEWKVDYHVVGMCVEGMRCGASLGELLPGRLS